MSKFKSGPTSFELVLDHSPVSKATVSFILKMLCFLGCQNSQWDNSTIFILNFMTYRNFIDTI